MSSQEVDTIRQELAEQMQSESGARSGGDICLNYGKAGAERRAGPWRKAKPVEESDEASRRTARRRRGAVYARAT